MDDLTACPKASGLFLRIASFDTLLAAHKKTMKGKGDRADVAKFEERREENIIQLANELIWHTYKPRLLRERIVREPKVRMLHIPAYCDRVVQQAVRMILGPIFERRQIFHSYACRFYKGTHKAMSQVHKYIREVARENNGRVYFLKGDIHHYYASIPHDILKGLIRNVISEEDVLWLLDSIIDCYGEDSENLIGIALGASTSQMFANVYMDIFDHFMKDDLGIKRYVRYSDDFVIVSGDKEYLRGLKREAEQFITPTLRLQLNHKTRIITGAEGCDFCGYRMFTNHILPRKRNVRKARRRLLHECRLLAAGKSTEERVRAKWASFLGYMRWCDGVHTTVGIWAEMNRVLRGEVGNEDEGA